MECREESQVNRTLFVSTSLVAKYKGSGSTDDAANFVCSSGF